MSNKKIFFLKADGVGLEPTYRSKTDYNWLTASPLTISVPTNQNMGTIGLEPIHSGLQPDALPIGARFP